jgi:hypothetical protein
MDLGSDEAPLDIAEIESEIEERWMTMATFAAMMGSDRAVTTVVNRYIKCQSGIVTERHATASANS